MILSFVQRILESKNRNPLPMFVVGFSYRKEKYRMARVNHSEVKKYAQQLSGRINNRGFFTSKMVQGYLEDFAEVITKRYDPKYQVKVNVIWEDSSDVIAYTDHRRIVINANNALIQKAVPNKERNRIWKFTLGFFYHELAHLLYTDFKYHESACERIVKDGVLSPLPTLPCEVLKDRLKNSVIARNLFMDLYHNLWNALEDGAIEYRFMNDYPIPADNLVEVREFHYSISPTLQDMIAEESTEKGNILFTLLNLIFQYAKYGALKCSKYDCADERFQFVTSCIPYIDTIMTKEDSEERYVALHNILCLLEPHLMQYINERLQGIDENQLTKEFRDAMESMPGQSNDGSRTMANASNSQGQGNEIQKPLAAPSTSNSSEVANSASNTTGSESAGSTSNNDSVKDNAGSSDSGQSGQEQVQTSTDNDSAPNNDASTDSDGNNATVPGESQQEEKDYSNLCQESSLSSGKSSQTKDSYDKASSDIERLLEKLAFEQAEVELEQSFTKELNEFNKKIEHGNIHQGKTCKIHRISSVDSKLIDQYNEVAPNLKQISRRLERGIKQVLKDKRDGGKLNNLYMGRGIHTPALARNDGKVFYKKRLPCDVPRIAVSLVLDESCSMRKMDRITYARITAIVIEEFCRNMEIPVGIYGHTTGYREDVEINTYADFDSVDDKDRYRLMAIQPRSANRDGYALRFAAERLHKQEAEIKLLIIVSDGKPNDDGYKGEDAFADLRGIKTEYRRKGIHLFAAAIGEDKEVIQSIYGDGFLDISNLEKMPMTLTNLIKKHIK